MIPSVSCRTNLMATIALCLPGVVGPLAHAAPTIRTFKIDSTKSSYTVQGSVADAANVSSLLVEQSLGSLTSPLTGYVKVESVPGGPITILSADLRSPDVRLFQPLGTPASVAYQATTSEGAFFGAQRNIDVTMQGTATPAADGTFSTDLFQYAFRSAQIDYFFPSVGNRKVNVINGVFVSPPAGLQGVWNESAPGGPRLAFDIAGLGVITGLRNGGSLSLQYRGTVEAVAVPEASSLVMGALGSLVVATSRLRRR